MNILVMLIMAGAIFVIFGILTVADKWEWLDEILPEDDRC